MAAGGTVVLILLVQVLTSIVGAVNADRGANDAARDTYAYVGDLMAERVYAVAQSAQDVVLGTVSEIERSGELPSKGDLLRAFADRLDREPAVGAIFLGTPDGNVTLLQRTDEGYSKIEIHNSADGVMILIRADFDRDFTRIGGSSAKGHFDLDSRPWYNQAVMAAGTHWTQPYVSLRSGDVVVSPSRAIELNGETVAVVGADIDLDSMGRLLDDIPIGSGARAFVFANDGSVIAAPDGSRELIRRLYDETGAIPDAGAIGLPTESPEVRGDNGEEYFETDGIVTLKRPLEGAQDLNWVLHLEAKSEDLAPGLHKFKQNTLFVAIASVVCALVALAIVLKMWNPIRRLGWRATTDPLTKMNNRFEFYRRGTVVLGGAEAGGRGVSVVVFDLDHFKDLNDAHGHDAGDAVLEAVGRAVADSIRTRDVAARLGGDEFGVLFDMGDSGNAFEVAERLRASVESRLRAAVPQAAQVGVTAGFATPCDAGFNLSDILMAADDALMEGKRTGKGRTYSAKDLRVAAGGARECDLARTYDEQPEDQKLEDERLADA